MFYAKSKELIYLHDPLATFIAFEGNEYTQNVNINIELMGQYTRGCIFEDKTVIIMFYTTMKYYMIALERKFYRPLRMSQIVPTIIYQIPGVINI